MKYVVRVLFYPIGLFFILMAMSIENETTDGEPLTFLNAHKIYFKKGMSDLI